MHGTYKNAKDPFRKENRNEIMEMTDKSKKCKALNNSNDFTLSVCLLVAIQLSKLKF